MADLVIQNGWVLTQDQNRRVIERGAVAIEGNIIKAVGTAAKIKDVGQAQKAIDATNKLVMPGFVDTHVHLASPLCRGLLDDIECVLWIERLFKGYYSLLNEESYRINAFLACLEMIKTGTTTFCECGTMPGMEEAAFEAVAKIGIRGVLARTMMDIYLPPGLEGFPIKESTDEGLSRAEEFIRRYHGQAAGRIQAWLDLHQVPNSTDALCLGCKELADKYAVGIMTHAAVTEPMVKMTKERFGLTDIERLECLGLLSPNFLAVHMGWVNEAELGLLKKRGVSVAHCPGSSMHGAYGSLSRGRFPEMLSLGINVALGCDGANCSNNFDMVRQMYLTATGHKEARLDPTIMTAQQVLDMATVNGAKALGLEDEIGSLVPGKKADIIIIDLMRPEWTPTGLVNLVSNLVYAASGDSVDTVIIDGQLVMENRRVNTVEERDILNKAQRAFEDIIKRIDWVK